MGSRNGGVLYALTKKSITWFTPGSVSARGLSGESASGLDGSVAAWLELADGAVGALVPPDPTTRLGSPPTRARRSLRPWVCLLDCGECERAAGRPGVEVEVEVEGEDKGEVEVEPAGA